MSPLLRRRRLSCLWTTSSYIFSRHSCHSLNRMIPSFAAVISCLMIICCAINPLTTSQEVLRITRSNVIFNSRSSSKESYHHLEPEAQTYGLQGQQHRSKDNLNDYLFPDKHRPDPIFDESTPRNITVASGKTVYLPCKVRHLGDRTISWIRKSDLHVLTVGKFTYTSDERFKAVHLENSDEWSLQIQFPTRRDANDYICQVSGHKQNLVVSLNVVLSSAKILEGPVVYLNSGSTLELTCLVNDTPGSPDYIFWHHNGEVISFDSYRGVRVETDHSVHPKSRLIIEKAHPSDSGNYSCVVTPYEFAKAAHVAVHVLPNGGHTAAIQHNIQHDKRSPTGEDTPSSSSSSGTSSSTSLVIFTSKSILVFLFLEVCLHHLSFHRHSCSS